MNTVLVLVMLILVIFALKEGMVWVALGIGLVMVLVSTSETKSQAAAEAGPEQQFMYPSQELPPIEGMKEQMLRVKYEPGWDGNNWWEDVAEHWGSSIGRTLGMIR